ncbi:MAG: hypothetical protein JXR71_02370 [Bacteroidales bacterium]|nr:hypothetical protein [Bacteroidales bacterium]
METKLKLVVSEVLILALIGFIGFLLVLASGFVGHHIGMSKDVFEYVLFSLTGLGAVAFAICSYRNCFRRK